MKKSILIILVFLSLAPRLLSQDISLNIITELNGVTNSTWPLVPVPTTSGVRVTFCNNDGGAVNVPAFKLRPLISVPPALVQIAPNAQQTDLPAGWSIITNTGTSIRLCNGTDTWAPGDCRDFLIHVIPISPGGPGTIVGNIFWADGFNCNTTGSPTVDNDPDNDRSTTSVTVVPGTPLPINLLSFKGSVSNCKTALNWKVSQDSNSDEFEVEQSTDGKTFTRINTVKAALNLSNYQSSADHPGGKVFYRLKMKDLDNKITYSNIISLTSSCNGSNDAFRVYPNPITADKVNVEFGKSGNYQVQLISAAGMVLRTENVVVTPGQVKQFQFTSYAKGSYLIRITNNATGLTKSEKLIVQ